MVRLPQNEKQTHRLNSWPQMWPSDLTLAVTLTLNFQGEIWIFIYLNQNWPDCHETKSKHIDLNSRPQIWPMGLTLAMTLIFEFWRSYVILTIWWPRSGVRIYQIVTGVTSDVGVPSTHLVFLKKLFLKMLSAKCQPCYSPRLQFVKFTCTGSQNVGPGNSIFSWKNLLTSFCWRVVIIVKKCHWEIKKKEIHEYSEILFSVTVLLTLDMLNCFEYYKRCIYMFESWLGFCSTQVDEINSATTIHVVCPRQPIPCLLMHWRL